MSKIYTVVSYFDLPRQRLVLKVPAADAVNADRFARQQVQQAYPAARNVEVGSVSRFKGEEEE